MPRPNWPRLEFQFMIPMSPRVKRNTASTIWTTITESNVSCPSCHFSVPPHPVESLHPAPHAVKRRIDGGRLLPYTGARENHDGGGIGTNRTPLLHRHHGDLRDLPGHLQHHCSEDRRHLGDRAAGRGSDLPHQLHLWRHPDRGLRLRALPEGHLDRVRVQRLCRAGHLGRADC